MHRRDVLLALTCVPAAVLLACRDAAEQQPAVDASPAAALDPWQPVDPAFQGCEGG